MLIKNLTAYNCKCLRHTRFFLNYKKGTRENLHVFMFMWMEKCSSKWRAMKSGSWVQNQQHGKARLLVTNWFSFLWLRYKNDILLSNSITKTCFYISCIRLKYDIYEWIESWIHVLCGGVDRQLSIITLNPRHTLLVPMLHSLTILKYEIKNNWHSTTLMHIKLGYWWVLTTIKRPIQRERHNLLLEQTRETHLGGKTLEKKSKDHVSFGLENFIHVHNKLCSLLVINYSLG